MASHSGAGSLQGTAASCGVSTSAISSPKSEPDLGGCGGDGLASSPLTASRRALMALRTSRSIGVRPREARVAAGDWAGVWAGVWDGVWDGVCLGVAGSPTEGPFRPCCGDVGSERAHAVRAHAVLRSRTLLAVVSSASIGLVLAHGRRAPTRTPASEPASEQHSSSLDLDRISSVPPSTPSWLSSTPHTAAERRACTASSLPPGETAASGAGAPGVSERGGVSERSTASAPLPA